MTPGRPVSSNCGTPTEKVSEYLDHILKSIMQKADPILKILLIFFKQLKILAKFWKEPSWFQQILFELSQHASGAGLEALRKRLNERKTPTIPTEELVKIANFVLKNNLFEFNWEVKRQKSGTVIGTKFIPPYACIFMEY